MLPPTHTLDINRTNLNQEQESQAYLFFMTKCDFPLLLLLRMVLYCSTKSLLRIYNDDWIYYTQRICAAIPEFYFIQWVNWSIGNNSVLVNTNFVAARPVPTIHRKYWNKIMSIIVDS